MFKKITIMFLCLWMSVTSIGTCYAWRNSHNKTQTNVGKALGIDIGGTKISYALINYKGKIQGKVTKIETPKTAKEIENTLKKIIKEFDKKVDFIAIATAGAVNNENTKIIGTAGNLPKGYTNINFQALSKNKKVFLENDANAAAWAEYKVGASKNCKHSVMLTLGTGVGAGIIIDGEMLKGKSGAAGEVHFPLSRHKERKCTCGAWDCFETYASGNGLRLTGAEIFNDENITTYDIVRMVKNNDQKAILALDTWQKDIALGIVGLNNIFDADCFVLSGSMEQFVNVKNVEKMVNESIIATPTKIYHAKAGNYSGMIGAVLYGLERIYNVK